MSERTQENGMQRPTANLDAAIASNLKELGYGE